MVAKRIPGVVLDSLKQRIDVARCRQSLRYTGFRVDGIDEQHRSEPGEDLGPSISGSSDAVVIEALTDALQIFPARREERCDARDVRVISGRDQEATHEVDLVVDGVSDLLGVEVF